MTRDALFGTSTSGGVRGDTVLLKRCILFDEPLQAIAEHSDDFFALGLPRAKKRALPHLGMTTPSLAPFCVMMGMPA